MFSRGDIVLIQHIDTPGYNMHTQTDVPMKHFPVPALVKQCIDRIIEVFWIHPVTKTRMNWHFLNEHFDKMELLEAA